MVDEVKNTQLGGNDLVQEGITPAKWNLTFDATVELIYADNTGGTSAVAAETDLATITVTQDDLNDNASFDIIAGFRADKDTGTTSGETFTWRLKIGGSTVKTITQSLTGDGSYQGGLYTGGAITYVATAQDSTAGNIIVKVTGEMGGTDGTIKCDGLKVVGYNR